MNWTTTNPNPSPNPNPSQGDLRVDLLHELDDEVDQLVLVHVLEVVVGQQEGDVVTLRASHRGSRGLGLWFGIRLEFRG
jgi:hypothetical protein